MVVGRAVVVVVLSGCCCVMPWLLLMESPEGLLLQDVSEDLRLVDVDDVGNRVRDDLRE